jgi:RNA polymerase sigma factor (TIGR02999 family)
VAAVPVAQPNAATTPITALINRWQGGDKAAEADLFDVLYPVLKRQALGALASCTPGKLSLSATELVHESYMRLIEQHQTFANRSHFMAIAARTLKRVLLDLIRARQTEKRGRELEFIALADDADAVAGATSPLALVGAIQRLEQLEKRDPLAAQVLELRLLGGLTNEEAAHVLGIGVATAGRHFAFARAWLAK